MSGTTADIIPIVIVPVVVLAFWLVTIFNANSHPQWGRQTPAETVSAHATEGRVPAEQLSSPGPVVPGPRLVAAAEEVTSRADTGQQNPTSMTS